MHKYIKKQLTLQKRSAIQDSHDEHYPNSIKKLRILCQTGQTISPEYIKKLLLSFELIEQKQILIKELLMYQKLSLVQELIESGVINKTEIIDLKIDLKLLYEDQCQSINQHKISLRKKSQELHQKQNENENIFMKKLNKKQFLNLSFTKIVKYIQKIKLKYYAIIFTMLIAILLKKHQKKLLIMVKYLLNV